MIEATTKWSVTRRKVFTNCARRYAIKYIDNNRPYLGQNKVSYQSAWDLMIKASRDIFFQLLADLHRGVNWSEKLIQSRVRFELTSQLVSFGLTGDRISIKQKNQLILSAFIRIKKILKKSIIARIVDNDIKEWSFHNRIKPVSFGHIEVYCSPDIVYRYKSKWHLVRINFQSERIHPYLELELCSMLLWSKYNQYLPNIDEKFALHGLFYNDSKWRNYSIMPSQKMLQESKQLLEKDVHNMNLLQIEFVRSMNPDKLPLANSNKYCIRCPYKISCPKFGFPKKM